MYRDLAGVSLFTCGGIGDLGFRAAGIGFLAMNEIEKDRASLARLNFPEATHFDADINDVHDTLADMVHAKLKDSKQELFLLTCTAPCQGMSSAGMGSLLNNARAGRRPHLDPRNRLVLPALRIIRKLRPLWVVFENVTGMRNTIVEDEQGELRPILDIIQKTLAPEYQGKAYDVEFADYGIPQRRQRLITVYTRDERTLSRFAEGIELIPPPTHARRPKGKLKPWVPLSEALRGFPPLDSSTSSKAKSKAVPFHRVPVLDAKKYEWIRNTPLGKSAFDNQCINPACRFQGNPTHGARRGTDGINRAEHTTPLYCTRCGSLLPRPYAVEQNGELRIMRGYTSAYKRMPPDLPAPTISRNLSFPCSDQKVHPFENRVLSLAEALRLQTIDKYEYLWGPLNYKNGAGRTITKDIAPDTLVRLIIAESIPPLFIELLTKHVMQLIFAEKLDFARTPIQPQLWGT